ncbi:hypothetical protein ACFLZJ_02020 [Nanoarchaeota archaeon]
MGIELIAGIVLIVIGILFFFNNKNIGKGAFKFYKKLYTKRNLTIMFKAAGVILIFGGLILIFLK